MTKKGRRKQEEGSVPKKAANKKEDRDMDDCKGRGLQ